MRSYPLYIARKDLEPRSWTYCVKASHFLRDTREAFELKRALELGERDPDDVPDSVFGRVAWGSDEENKQALEAAAKAATVWNSAPIELRRWIGHEFHRVLSERVDEFVDILVAEGHPVKLAQWEASGVIKGSDPDTLDMQFDQFETRHEADGQELILARKADGVVCLNPPQNAAGSNSALGLAAILAGNSLVVKAPRTTPISVMFLYRDVIAPILDRAGAPPGTLNLISGDTKRILRTWTNSPLVDDVMFFGDSSVGLKIGNDCVSKGKKPVLELAGNDGVVVWRDADVEQAVGALCECFYGSSQICMVPKYVLAHPAIADELIERLVEAAAEITPGFPEDPDVLLSPVLKQDKFYDYLAEAESSGAEVLSGGGRLDVHGQPSPDGLFFEPTVLRIEGLGKADELRVVREETFFPMLPVVVPEDVRDDILLEQTIAFVNANPYGLRNSLWAGDDYVIELFTAQVKNGGLLKVNCSHIGFVPYLSTHGGTGRTGGPFGELNYPMLRTSHMQGITVGAKQGADDGRWSEALRRTRAPAGVG